MSLSVKATASGNPGLGFSWKEQQFGDRSYEDRTLVLQSLPAIGTPYRHWLHLQDQERLSPVPKALHTFSVHLDLMKRQMGKVKRHRTGGQEPNLTQSVFRIQRDLEDLIGQVTSQLGRMDSTTPPHASTSPAPSSQPRSTSPKQDRWSSALRGYIVLRDLDRYLGRLARDFIILNSRHRG
ncbi:hypothetical protein AAFF_G00376370 [Aldrovandia affinis]|uniref:Uncharacterized protein n=1 Tax=Aldrovandia affinis TaxID=143900 RepID=A0AAD7WLQ3_9TELE|nr:hypothetical protein AAFF_G00376370 [Aldrovandia affinis]